MSGVSALGQGAGWNAHENRMTEIDRSMALGRWPANLIHDGSDEVVALFPAAPGQQAAITGNEPTANGFSGAVSFSGMKARVSFPEPRGDTGSAARFFYCAKASRSDRNDLCDDEVTDRTSPNHHPTVKPTELMRYLCRLVTPPGGIVFDPFAGSGSTGIAALAEGFRFIGVEIEHEYLNIAQERLSNAQRQVRMFA